MVSVSAYMRTSNIQYAQFDSGHGGYWQPDRDMCEAGQDFVVQIAPFGCTPAVVRADLLEEQNVPVFCQLAATKINPLIEVDAIEQIRFSGKYPKEVSGIGFHPAQAALGVDKNLNSPILNNIGYAVIVLKKQENASAMPEFVTGNLTAEIRYDIKNAFGIGKASFYLPEMSDADWEDKKPQYSFWDGRGYLRVEGVDESGARISVYDDTRKIASVDLEKGKTSRMIYLPGFDCLAGLQLKLDGLEAPDTRAKLNINGEIVEVAEDERFLENRCWVKKINKKGLVQEVEVYCKGDEERGSFDLRISPKVELEICERDGSDCETKDYEVGDKLPYEFSDPDKEVYLGFIGAEGDANKKENLYVRFVQTPYHGERLTDNMLSEVARYDGASYDAQTGGGLSKVLQTIVKSSGAWIERFTKYLVKGTEISKKLKYGKGGDATFYILDNVYGKNIKIIGFAGAVDKEFDTITNQDIVSPSYFELDVFKFFTAGDSIYIKSKINYKGERPMFEFDNWFNKNQEGNWEAEDFGDLIFSDEEINEFYLSDNFEFVRFEVDGESYEKEEFYEFFEDVSEKKISLLNIKYYYENAKDDYNAIIKSFPSEKYIDEDEGFDELTFGEEALYQKILLTSKTDQKKTVIDLCKEFENQYPDSKKILKEQCDSEYKLSSSEIANRDVSINGIVKGISLEGIYEPKWEEYSAEITIINAKDDCSGGVVLQKNKDACFSDSEFIILKELHDDYALFDVSSVNEGLLKNVAWKKNYLKIKLNEYKVIGENKYQIKLTKINLKKSAKVSVIPNIDNAGTEANFSFKIGIEQRAIKLSPEKTREKIKKLNKTIADWEEKSEQLGKVVKGLKTACLGVGAYVTIKNFFANTGGQAIARQEVMKEINLMCADAINGQGKWGDKGYKTLDECFVEKSDYIDDAVEVKFNAQQEVDKIMEDAQNKVGFTGEKWFGEEIYDESKIANEVRPITKTNLINLGKISKDPNDKNSEAIIIKYDEDNVIFNAFTKGTEASKYVSLNEIRDIQRDVLILKGDISGATQDDKYRAEVRLYQKLSDIEKTSEKSVERASVAKEMDVPEDAVLPYSDKDTITFDITNPQKLSGDNYADYVDECVGCYYAIVPKNRVNYLVTYGQDGNIREVYEDEEGDGEWDLSDELGNVKIKIYSQKSYQNKYTSSLGETTPCLRYYETEPYKGLPAIVPFDLNEGWYASVGQTLPVFGGISSYEESGRVTSFWVCNVGENKMEENKGGDDICQMINTGTGQPYNVFHGLDSGKASGIIRDAQEAVEEASRIKTRTSGQRVTINGQSVRVCEPAVDIPDMQCQNFMSPKDCQLLFNVCDPVVCPSSRCNFGGTYHVKDVIQSGIIGSILLCLPNAREGILIPVCLTGIKAGIDGLISVYTSYRDCLQESLDTGKMVGICDEIYSIHLCEFFWRQSLPLAKMIIPKMMEIALGQNVRGGGEYLGVASAWDNAENSIDYFAQYYAASSYEAFKGRIVEGIGDAVCKNSISGVYPDGGNLLDSLTEPDSPPQFHGRFDEIPFTTATNPPISHYKVFYHIYAGKESRAYYQVYLKSPAGASFYQDTPIRNVASGYITTGGYATETKDFTAPSGYKELCIMVNNQEECGFKQVSTSYAVNYVNDKYMEEQTSERDIKSEKECIGGSVSAYSLLSPSLEGAADEMINPAIYDRGIIRICATESPGKGTDGKYGTENARWIDVGNCGVENIKCWLDKESVENVIKHTDIEDKVLEEHSKSQLELLKEAGNYFAEGEFESLVKDVKKLIEDKKFEEAINEISEDVMKKAFLNKEKAELLLLRGNAYSGLVGEKEREEVKKKVPVRPATTEKEGDEGKEDVNEEVGEEGDVKGDESCKRQIGEKILKVIEDEGIKTKYNINDEQVKKDTKENVKNFECLVLQIAMQESSLQHCEKESKEGDCFYCDKEGLENLRHGYDLNAYGVMQINLNAHPKMENDVDDFEKNVIYGVEKVLIEWGYNLYKNGEFFSVNKETYYGWESAIRSYNGWGSGGIKYYVEEVTGERDKSNGENTKEGLVKIFPECGEEETKTGMIEEIYFERSDGSIVSIIPQNADVKIIINDENNCDYIKFDVLIDSKKIKEELTENELKSWIKNADKGIYSITAKCYISGQLKSKVSSSLTVSNAWVLESH